MNFNFDDIDINSLSDSGSENVLTCKCCSEKFLVFNPSIWVYKIRRQYKKSDQTCYFCSWKCLQEYRRKHNLFKKY